MNQQVKGKDPGYGKSVDNFFYGLCKRVGSPKSLGVWLRYRDAPKELAAAELDPEAYHNAATFAADYLVVSLLAKYQELRTGIDTKKVALDGFAADEFECALTNKRLHAYATSEGVPSVIRSDVERMKQIVQNVWGQPTFRDFESFMGWGPGATASLKGTEAWTEPKMRFPIEVTPTAAPYLKKVLSRDHLWLAKALNGDVVGPFSLLNGAIDWVKHAHVSRQLTVPKNAKTDRVICAEPTGNIFLQKGVGGYLRARLKRCGVNLDDQSRNQSLAAEAHTTGLATIDLRHASNTISIGVVRLLSTPDMFLQLNRLRTPAYRPPGTSEQRRFEMFSSMGNGFTFELESLIFYAAVKAVVERLGCTKPIAIYGDDIICSQEAAKDVISLLSYLGFRTNEDKSFLMGRFFESCGKHYFDGVDVTPVFQKRAVNSTVEHMHFSNKIHRWLVRNPAWNDLLRPLWQSQLEMTEKRFEGYDWMLGDGYYVVPDDQPVGLKFCPRKGLRLAYVARLPKRNLGDRGLYAYKMD